MTAKCNLKAGTDLHRVFAWLMPNNFHDMQMYVLGIITPPPKKSANC